MDCDHSQHLLIDIACGETDSAETAAARLHAEGCASCGALLRKLEQGAQLTASLVLAEPSPQVSDRIMQRARAHVLASRALTPPAARVSAPVRSLADRMREFLSQFAMGRQVAMASVMVLVVAVGLWFVPKARHHELAGGNIVNPDPEGEAGPSDGVAPAGGIVPAAPLDLDLRQGRIRTRGEGPEPTSMKAASTTASQTSEATAATEASGAPETPEAPSAEKAVAAELQGLDEGAPGASTAVEARDREADALGDLDVADLERKGRSRALAAEPSSTALRDDVPAEPEAFAQTAPAAPAPSAAPQPARTSPAQDMPTLNPYGGYAPPPPSAGSRRASAGAGLGSASESIEESATTDAPKNVDMLALARSAQRRGRCAEAVVHYEAYLRTAPRNRTAMLEAATCYRQLGRQTDATRWTTRANAIATTTMPKSAERKTEPTVPTQAQ